MFLHSKPPSTAYAYAECKIGFDELKSGKRKYDALVIPGGLFSTNGVLRNDNDLSDVLIKYWTNDEKVDILLFDSGIALIYNMLISDIKMPRIPEIEDD